MTDMVLVPKAAPEIYNFNGSDKRQYERLIEKVTACSPGIGKVPHSKFQEMADKLSMNDYAGDSYEDWVRGMIKDLGLEVEGE